jgi:membrane protease subunit (stomatin/prohibitin family)
MALVDRVKFNSPDDSFLVWKFPNEELSLGTQLIVNQSQEAVFVKSGVIVDIFGPGTHTLSTGNLPLLNKIINFPFGGKTPFTAEIWYVNKTAKRDLKWGTNGPIQIIDPLYNFPVSVRSFGKWGIRVENSRSFVTQLVGTLRFADSEKIEEYFGGEIIQRLSDALAKYFVEKRVPVLHVAAKLNELSLFVQGDISSEFERFGIEIVNFNVERVSIPPEEQQRFQDIMAKRLEMETFSQIQVGHGYVAAKSFETLEKAAGNEGAAGGLLAGGLGLGMGLGGGMVAGQQLAQNINVQPSPPTPQAPIAATNDDPVAKMGKLKNLLEGKLISQEDFDKKKAEILATL